MIAGLPARIGGRSLVIPSWSKVRICSSATPNRPRRAIFFGRFEASQLIKGRYWLEVEGRDALADDPQACKRIDRHLATSSVAPRTSHCHANRI